MRKHVGLARMQQRSQAITTLMVLLLVLLLIQLWLITAALEEYLAAKHALAVPTFLASGFCFLLSLGLLKLVNDIDNGD